MKRVKNATGTVQTWVGQMIQPGEYYTLELHEQLRWANDPVVDAAISAGHLQVADATTLFFGSEARQYLRSSGPADVIFLRNQVLVDYAGDILVDDDFNVLTGDL